ncbi:hypothetical protein U472_02085 [Orenia metallireducens]|uniref:DUF421 domain-containing protein n=1 Tax=Orenia metallireducens TaxID=1413210 RepID=A0A1C0ACB5_9FIRM|nr:DUF421 domain-containing protein [Orenia metallireducens]OCL28012.1 hypothetical protein U472_02085 [Orenia metallireducens]
MNETLVVIIRGLIGLFTLLIYTRILGKHQISQLTYFDYIIGIVIGSIAATLTTDLDSRTWTQWVGLTTWAVTGFILEWSTLKSRKISKYLEGEPTIVIMNGKIMENNLSRMKYKVDDLLAQLRNKKIFNPSTVEFAILEKNGKLSILKKSQYQNLTPKDMNLPTNYKGLSVELIYDGIVIEQNLKQVNLDHNWLTSQLRKHGINNISEVVLVTLDTSGKLYIDTKSDNNLEVPIDLSDYPGSN